MDEKRMLEEEALKLINGGILREGWDETVYEMMALYKGKFGESGKARLITLFEEKGVGGDSPLEPKDIPVIVDYINANWDAAPSVQL
jgi:hypothetical protein